MYPFVQYTFAIIAIILTFLLTAIFLPHIIDLWRDWIEEIYSEWKNKHKCPQ